MQSKVLRIANNVVTNVEIVSDEWLQNYAGDDLLILVDESNVSVGIGWTYVPEVGFYSPQPFPSWSLNGLKWEAPKPKLNQNSHWDETTLEWVQ